MTDEPTREFRRADWMADAECAGLDRRVRDAIFFPGRGESVHVAKAICGVCPVRVECLEHALANGERFGVWGGKSERERRAMRGRIREGRGGGRPITEPCGTYSAYRRHLRHGELPCGPCRAANAAEKRGAS